MTIHGKLSNREYSEIKNTVMFSTFTVIEIKRPRQYYLICWHIRFLRSICSVLIVLMYMYIQWITQFTKCKRTDMHVLLLSYWPKTCWTSENTSMLGKSMPFKHRITYPKSGLHPQNNHNGSYFLANCIPVHSLAYWKVMFSLHQN
jgi:hypothetical protein